MFFFLFFFSYWRYVSSWLLTSESPYYEIQTTFPRQTTASEGLLGGCAETKKLFLSSSLESF